MLLAPIRVGSFGSLRDLGPGVTEDKPNVEQRVLLLDQQMLLSVLGKEAALALNDNSVFQFEVWSVLGLLLWFDVGYCVLFVGKPHPFRGEGFGYCFFQSRSKAIL